MKILVLDNYDSFVYNLVHIIRELSYGVNMQVIRNNKIDLEEVSKFDKILLSPGPGIPSEAGIMPQIIKRYASKKSILGVCLGHQGIAEAFGAKLQNFPDVLHGIATPAKVQANAIDKGLFVGIPQTFAVARYHSWTVRPETLPDSLQATAFDNDGRLLALQHRQHKVFGVQFHPESILTEHGTQIMRNWLES